MKRLFLALWLIWSPLANAAPLPATGTVEVLFSPWDDAERAIIHVLNDARHSIYVQAYVLSSRSIARALLYAHGRGVKVFVLADGENAEKSETSQLDELARGGVPIWLETRYAAAHNKVMLIDAEYGNGTIITGSYNFSWAAQARNAENLLILRGNNALVQRYLENWKRHRAEAQVWKSKH